MISINNNVRFRFRDSDRDSQVILNKKDYNVMLNKIKKQLKCSKIYATMCLHNTFFNHITTVYGLPNKMTIIVDGTVIH